MKVPLNEWHFLCNDAAQSLSALWITSWSETGNGFLTVKLMIYNLCESIFPVNFLPSHLSCPIMEWKQVSSFGDNGSFVASTQNDVGGDAPDNIGFRWDCYLIAWVMTQLHSGWKPSRHFRNSLWKLVYFSVLETRLLTLRGPWKKYADLAKQDPHLAKQNS